MSSVGQFVIWSLAILVVGFLSARALRAYLKYRGKRLITCPENHRPAAVEVDASRAAGSALVAKPELRLRECSRWPEKHGCGQMCLHQIEQAPDGCLVRNIVDEWYAGKKCAVCSLPIHEIDWLGHKPALLDPVGQTVYWDAVPAENLPEILQSHFPVCWDCHVAYTLRREHPELVTERPWRWKS